MKEKVRQICMAPLFAVPLLLDERVFPVSFTKLDDGNLNALRPTKVIPVVALTQGCFEKPRLTFLTIDRSDERPLQEQTTARTIEDPCAVRQRRNEQVTSGDQSC